MSFTGQSGEYSDKTSLISLLTMFLTHPGADFFSGLVKKVFFI